MMASLAQLSSFGWPRAPPENPSSIPLETMKELLRTNDLVLISAVEAILAEEGVSYFVADQHMSVLEGSAGFLPRRILVVDAEFDAARRILTEAGLAKELRDV